MHAGAIPRSSRSIRDGSGQIVLKNLQCTGTELRLIDCRHDGLGNNRSCSHSDGVGVRCTGMYSYTIIVHYNSHDSVRADYTCTKSSTRL